MEVLVCSDVDVRLNNETVWLSRQEMAGLFDRDYKTVSKDINNVFKEGELEKESVVANVATTGADGKIYQVEFSNLDVIISVGYRVKSQRGTQFRITRLNSLKSIPVLAVSSFSGKTASAPYSGFTPPSKGCVQLLTQIFASIQQRYKDDPLEVVLHDRIFLHGQ